MKFKITKDELEEAISRFIGRDVLGVCGDGFKGKKIVHIGDVDKLIEQITVEIILPQHVKKIEEKKQ